MKLFKTSGTFLLPAACLLLISCNVSCSNDGPEFGKATSGWKLTNKIDLTRSEQSSMEGMEEFSHKLMEAAADHAVHSGNGEFCVSPVSVSIYLGMLANAAEGELHDEILEALGSQNIDDLNTLSRKLLQYLPCDENGSSLTIGNSFWVAKGIEVPKDFISKEVYYYNAPVETVDFHKEKTVGDINRWVYDNTGGKIPGIFDFPWECYKDTKMVSACTVYFKGDWESQFSKSNTDVGKFKTPAGAVDTQMMHKTKEMVYYENDSLQYVRLGFERYRDMMELYLPAEGTEMQEFLKYLSASKMAEIRDAGESWIVTLSMPSFNKESKAEIMDVLTDIGISSLERADLSPMGIKEMRIEPIHKVSIKVDEGGAELAAVTADPMGITDIRYEEPRRVTVDFDRPFVYIIRNGVTGAVLLAGILNDPR